MGSNAATRREHKKELTRRRIHDAAWRLFNARGFDATTVREIAVAADVAERTFFRHFASKEAVVFSDQEQILKELRDALDERPRDEGAIDAIRSVTITRAGSLQGDPDQLRARLRLGAESSSLAAYGRNVVLRGWEEVIAAWVADRYGYRRARDPEPLFLACLASGALIAASGAWSSGSDRPFTALVEDAFAVLAGDGPAGSTH